ncbi:tigger transposable element-derived protein 1-like [Palaemon carinicauda]|uniref:tigger transposable element-derived protein 1-like n=1 Tax=Palaemon carinicauda TaxID=392227 RepID=UPI0035B68267
MPRRTYIAAEEKTLPGHKPMKDRLTVAFCANARGDLKFKPLLVYHSENPRDFKAQNITKDRLSVFWRSNGKVWVTRPIFIEWVNVCFGLAVKNFLEVNNLPLKCLLVLDNAPANPPDLEDIIHPDFSFIKVLYLPLNTTPLLQPMARRVIANFKKLYTKHLFKRCFEVTENKAVDDPAAPEGDVEEIISTGRSMVYVVDEADVHNLIEEHRKELTTEDLKELEAMQLTIIQEEHSSIGGEDGGGGGGR